ncbi:MAG: hypothetical protein R2728_10685 [Chitinophagales bacterium]
MIRSASISRNILLVILSISILFSCKSDSKNENSLEVILTSFKGEIQAKDNLTFTFNHAIVEADTLLNKWLNANYLEFSPKVEGKYKWIANDELVFSPVDQFQFATEYTASLNKDILALNDQFNKWKGDKAFVFNTPYLELRSVYATWSKEENTAKTKITSVFNIPVSSQLLAKNLSITINGDDYPFEVKENSNDTEHTIILTKDPDPDKQQKIEVALKQIDKTSKSASQQQAILIAKSELRILKIEPIAEGLRSGIKVYSSQQVESYALKSVCSLLNLKSNMKLNLPIMVFSFNLTKLKLATLIMLY